MRFRSKLVWLLSALVPFGVAAQIASAGSADDQTILRTVDGELIKCGPLGAFQATITYGDEQGDSRDFATAMSEAISDIGLAEAARASSAWQLASGGEAPTTERFDVLVDGQRVVVDAGSNQGAWRVHEIVGCVSNTEVDR